MYSFGLTEIIFISALLNIDALSDGASRQEKRKGKLFSVFNVITFPNSVCSGTGSKNGTCYTTAECAAKGGVSGGTCASNYGVCCIFSLACGQMSSQNCSYFESTGGANPGACSVKICPTNSNICQLRLDFNSFVISGPSTSTTTVTNILNGIANTAGVGATTASQCLTDIFTVTNPNGLSPPVICGTNSGQHMFVESSIACNNLAFQLGTAGVGTTLATRTWSIKITQYACNYNNLAPPGCTQYYFGSNTGVVMTYNFNGGEHLANQNQNICIRRERGNCRICWTTINAATDFSVSAIGFALLLTKQQSCCGYGANGVAAIGADCATIPDALTTKLTMQGASRICGSILGLLALKNTGGAIAVAGTVCAQNVPFSVRFLSDGYEFPAEITATVRSDGFRLSYIMSTSGCPTTTTSG